MFISPTMTNIYARTHAYTHTHTHTHKYALSQPNDTHTYAYGVYTCMHTLSKTTHTHTHTDTKIYKQRWGRWDNLCTYMFALLFYHNETLRLANCPLMNNSR